MDSRVVGTGDALALVSAIDLASFIFFEKMNDNSTASAILVEPSCAVEDNKILSALVFES